jgi:RNA polymerase sigma-70 factor (ECF subfamily)
LNREEVDYLFVRYREPVFRFLRRFVRDSAAAEDLAQETFLRAMKGSYSQNGYERAWVFQIARNIARDHLRALGRAATAVELIDHPGQSADPGVQLDLDAALGALGEDDREVFLLKEVGGLAYAEIAAACDLTEDAVRSRLHRTRLALRRLLT